MFQLKINNISLRFIKTKPDPFLKRVGVDIFKLDFYLRSVFKYFSTSLSEYSPLSILYSPLKFIMSNP